ncbi:ethanolamine utilization ethanol dehydrogenase EutG [soil metagenome]
MTPFTFRHSTREIIFGWGAADGLGKLAVRGGGRRVALVVDSVFRDSAMLSDLVGQLSEATGADPTVCFVPPHEPDTEVVDACLSSMRSGDPDVVIAIGGGSTMDAAKVARVMLANAGSAADLAGFDVAHEPHRSLFIGVPTTAGTGSEVSEMAVISQTGANVKLRYRSTALPFHIALLDPRLTVSMPASVTAQTGFDAFTHALEGHVSKSANIMTEPLSLNAMALLARWLPTAVHEPDNREARSACLLASMQAAMAFNTSQLGLCHAIAAPLGALYHVAHGRANALALPAVTAFNETVLGDKGRVIAELLGARSASLGVARLRTEVGLDGSLDELGIDAAGRESIAVAALLSGNIAHNPRAVDLEASRAVVEAMR